MLLLLLGLIAAFTVLPCSAADKKGKANDYYAAIVHMEPLVIREQQLTEQFLDMIKTEEAKLDKMEREIDEIERVIPRTDCTDTEITEFIGNPVNALKLIQRFTELWPNITNMYSGEDTSLSECILKLCFRMFLLFFTCYSKSP